MKPTRGVCEVVLFALVVVVGLSVAARRSAADSTLADLQQVTSKAVARVAPSVVRISVPELTKEQIEEAKRLERERRMQEWLDQQKERGNSDEAPKEGDSDPEAAPDDSAGPDEPPADDAAPKAADTSEDKPIGKASVCTGLLISGDGYVITSLVTVGQQGQGLKVELADGRALPAKRLGEDVQRDLLLLKIEGKDLPAPEAAPKSDLAVGQWVLALGRALPIEQPTVSKGIISALDRQAGVAVQTDANISAMNYGGPLIDLQGRVVGVIVSVGRSGSTAKVEELSDSGIGFAIPMADVTAKLDALKAGRRLEVPDLGIRFDSARLKKGAEVTFVWAASGAKEAGVEDGDVIIEFEGVEIETPFQLFQMLGSRNVGDVVAFKVERGTEVLTLSATLKALPEHRRR